MSTADCKQMLVEEFPATSIKEWKRTSKYLNGWKEEVRVFTHPTVGTVYVLEEEGHVITDPLHFEVRKASDLKPSDFFFFINSSGDCGPYLQVYLVFRAYFEKNGHLESVHLQSAVERFFPEGLECEEEMEACFSVGSVDDPEALKRMFIDSGFQCSEALDRLMSGGEPVPDQAISSPAPYLTGQPPSNSNPSLQSSDATGVIRDLAGIKPNTEYRFTKSGNLVKTVSPTDYGGAGHWQVVRVDTGKEMIVHGSALADPNDPQWSKG